MRAAGKGDENKMARFYRSDWGRIFLFALAQAIVIAGVVTATSQRWAMRQAARALPPLREQAIVLPPLYDCPWMVTEEQLEATLRKVFPRYRVPEPKINHVDHALRFWGPDAVFDDPQALSGAEMRDILLNHECFMKVWPTAPPYLEQGKEGLTIRTQEGLSTASHMDHSLASISETGIRRDYPVISPEGPTTFQELFETSLKEFSLDQMEYEWSILAYTLFLPPTTSWITSEGQEVNFDILAERLMRETLPAGVCFGNHRLHSLVTILRVDAEVTPLLRDKTRKLCMRFLTLVCQQLTKSQHPYGCWDGEWVNGQPSKASLKKGDSAIFNDTLRDQLVATGHALEWLAWAPEEVLPPREVLTRAAQWFVRTIEKMEPDKLRENYAYASHGAHALALWRKTEPAPFMKTRLKISKVSEAVTAQPPAAPSEHKSPKPEGT